MVLATSAGDDGDIDAAAEDGELMEQVDRSVFVWSLSKFFRELTAAARIGVAKLQSPRSIRTLLKIVGAKSNARVNLKIYEPEGSRKPMGDRGERAPRAAEPVMTEPDTSVLDDLKI